MSTTKYLVLSLPQSSDSRRWLDHSLFGGRCNLSDFRVPDFQVGTLDSLVQQSDELDKFDQQLKSSTAKVVDILKGVVEGTLVRTVNSANVTSYVESFAWNTSKYRLDKSIPELAQLIAAEAQSLDNDVRAAYQAYQAAKSNFLAADRKKNGDLSIKSLHEIVKPEDFVLNSEHLVTVLIAVPKNLDGEFKSSYETLTQFVIPRSAKLVSHDEEYNLYSVTLFKKYQQEFTNGCREKKWHPRTDFTYDEDTLNNMRKEFDLTRATESKAKNDLIRLAKTAYSDIFSAWFHIKAIRVFVESVLRYGLPPQFDCVLIKFEHDSGNVDKVKKELIAKYGYLGGDGFSNKSNLHEYASLVDPDYEPFVIYEVELV